MAFSGTWSSPEVSGIRPPPCKDCSLTMIDERYAVMFGGTQPGPKATNDVYIGRDKDGMSAVAVISCCHE